MKAKNEGRKAAQRLLFFCLGRDTVEGAGCTLRQRGRSCRLGGMACQDRRLTSILPILGVICDKWRGLQRSRGVTLARAEALAQADVCE